ncbi:AAA domain protein [uncultured archaeon]|nr:AAA domain protein [uncultured archaeon]
MIERYVLTGGPCCGKTTLINELRKKGYQILDEVAREVLDGRKRKSLEDGMQSLQEEIFEKQMIKEDKLNGKTAFLDRGLIDGFAYQNIFLGYVSEDFKKKIKCREKYSEIFVLDRLPYKNDGIRKESDEEAQKIHEEIIRQYQNQGYSPIFIPVKENVEQRVDLILKYLNGGKNE